MDGLLALLSPDTHATGSASNRRAYAAAVRSPPLAGERLARLQLAATERVGPVTYHELLQRFGSATAALAALPGLAAEAGLRRPPAVPPAHEITAEAAALQRIGGRHLVIGDADYPAALAALADAPPVLRVCGDTRLFDRPLIALVGARNASTAGRRMAGDLARDLGAAGLVVVSGLARGIDTAAHQATLETGTIAVVAGGLDIVYPPENEALYRAIVGSGLLLTEMPLGAVPQARHFPRRNRIISGLCAGVVVVEAALQSGSLITAQRAADQGRDVFAVPGSPLDPRCRGSNRLLKDGAQLVECAADILDSLPRCRIAAAATVPASSTGAAREPQPAADPARETHDPEPALSGVERPPQPMSVASKTPPGRPGLSTWRRLLQAGNSAWTRKPRARNDPTPEAAVPYDRNATTPSSPSRPGCEAAPDTNLTPRRACPNLTPSVAPSSDTVSRNRESVASATAERAFSAPRPVTRVRPADVEKTAENIDSATETGLPSVRARVLECLGPGPAAVDEIVRQCQVSAAAVQAILLELELSGRLERHRGNAVSLL